MRTAMGMCSRCANCQLLILVNMRERCENKISSQIWFFERTSRGSQFESINAIAIVAQLPLYSETPIQTTNN